MWYGASNPKKSELISYVGRDVSSFPGMGDEDEPASAPLLSPFGFKNKNKNSFK
jgi:hypothetical protein